MIGSHAMFSVGGIEIPVLVESEDAGRYTILDERRGQRWYGIQRSELRPAVRDVRPGTRRALGSKGGCL